VWSKLKNSINSGGGLDLKNHLLNTLLELDLRKEEGIIIGKSFKNDVTKMEILDIPSPSITHFEHHIIE